MVGRIELLTPERERLAEQAVRDLASPEAAARERAFDVPPRPGTLRRADRPPGAQDDRGRAGPGPLPNDC